MNWRAVPCRTQRSLPENLVLTVHWGAAVILHARRSFCGICHGAPTPVSLPMGWLIRRWEKGLAPPLGWHMKVYGLLAVFDPLGLLPSDVSCDGQVYFIWRLLSETSDLRHTLLSFHVPPWPFCQTAFISTLMVSFLPGGHEAGTSSCLTSTPLPSAGMPMLPQILPFFIHPPPSSCRLGSRVILCLH